MPLEQPQHMPQDMEELDLMVAKAYSQGIDTGRAAGRLDTLEAVRQMFERIFFASKGRSRRADPNNPKTAAILEVWEKFNNEVRDGKL